MFFNTFIFSLLLINNIQCLKLNINLINESNVYEIKTTDYQAIGPLGFHADHDYYVFKNGDYYDGKFLNGLANDTHGKYYFKDKGTKYTGEFKNGKIEGKGYYHKGRGPFNSIIYEGEFKDGMADGKGIYIYKNKDKYEGEFRNGKREGKGEYKWIIYDKKEVLVPYLFKGYFENDNFGDVGTFFYTNGDKYKGQLKDRKRHGKGIYYWEDGDRYEGDFKNDKREGNGVYYWNNGDRAIGDYLNDKEVGMHVILHSNGQVTQKYYEDK